MKKFYLAAQLTDIDYAGGLISLIESAGKFQCAYNWTARPSVVGKGLLQYRERAEAEVAAIRESDFFIMLAPGGRGSHVEFGVAASRNIPILIVYGDLNQLDSPYPSVFHYLPQVTRLQLASSEEIWRRGIANLRLWLHGIDGEVSLSPPDWTSTFGK